jgi:hypothetical protein
MAPVLSLEGQSSEADRPEPGPGARAPARSGKDRTGIVEAPLLMAAGVTRGRSFEELGQPRPIAIDEI